jgi:hypothetical protein
MFKMYGRNSEFICLCFSGSALTTRKSSEEAGTVRKCVLNLETLKDLRCLSECKLLK